MERTSGPSCSGTCSCCCCGRCCAVAAEADVAEQLKAQPQDQKHAIMATVLLRTRAKALFIFLIRYQDVAAILLVSKHGQDLPLHAQVVRGASKAAKEPPAAARLASRDWGAYRKRFQRASSCSRDLP